MGIAPAGEELGTIFIYLGAPQENGRYRVFAQNSVDTSECLIQEFEARPDATEYAQFMHSILLSEARACRSQEDIDRLLAADGALLYERYQRERKEPGDWMDSLFFDGQ